METPEPAQAVDADERYRRALAHAVLRGVVHDLNNPLATVMMAAAALRAPADEAQRNELIDIVEREAMRAGALATDAAQRYAAGPATTGVPLEQLVSDVRAGCRAADLEVAVHLATTPGTVVEVDPKLLPHALVAFAADAHGAPARQQSVEVGIGLADGELTVTIRDDGHPMSEAVARRPFQPFLAEAPAERGIGLAVAAARSHIRLQGGRVEVRPGTDTGTEVVVRLPAPAQAARDEATDAESSAGRALVVDDDRPMRDLLTLVLRRVGWEVATAAGGDEAAAALAARPVDLVLLDLHLGSEDGPAVAADLERHRPGIGDLVVYLTGDVPPSGVIDGRPALAKPFALEDLYRVIDDMRAPSGPL